jgi:DNA polymerase-3 subunit beta
MGSAPSGAPPVRPDGRSVTRQRRARPVGLHVCVSTAVLRSALATVGRATGPRRLGAHLDCVRLEARGGELRLRCNDHCITIEQRLTGVALTDGEAMVPWSPLADLVRTCPTPMCEIRFDPPDHVVVRAEERTATLAALPSGALPNAALDKNLDNLGTFSGPRFREAVETVVPAAATRGARVALTGVLLRCGSGALTLAATDGRRLAVRRVDAAGPSAQSVLEVVVPAVHLAEVGRCLLNARQAVRISLSAARNVAIFDLADVCLESRLLDVTFPRFERVISSDFRTKLACPTQRLIEDLRFIGSLLTRTSRVVTVETTATGLLLCVRRRSSGDAAQAAISARVWGEPVTVHLDYDDLLSTISTISAPTVVLGFNGPRGTAIVLPSGKRGSVTALAPSFALTDEVD